MMPFIQTFPVPVMMGIPIQFGMIQGSPNKSNSPQPQIQDNPNLSPQQQSYKIRGYDHIQPIVPVFNQVTYYQNQNYSPYSKKKDASIVIIDHPSSSSLSTDKQNCQTKEGTTANSKVAQKADRKLTERRNNKGQEMLSSTSLGDRIARSCQEKNLKQSDISNIIQEEKVAPPEAKRNARHSLAGNTNSDKSQEHQHHQSTQKKPQQVIIDDNLDDSEDIHECILVEDSVEEISEQNYNIKKQRTKQYQHYIKNIINLQNPNQTTKYYVGLHQNVSHDELNCTQPNYLKQQQLHPISKKAHENQYVSPHMKKQPDEPTSRSSTKQNITNDSYTARCQSPDHHVSQSPQSPCQSSGGVFINGGGRVQCNQDDFIETIGTNLSKNSIISQNSDDQNKRTRKHNTRYNNDDFISGEYMYAVKRQNNKRSNPIQFTPTLKKKSQKCSNYNNKLSLSEIINKQNLFEKQNIQKSKGQFAKSVKNTEIVHADKKASQKVFTLSFSKRKVERKLSSDVQNCFAYFQKNINQAHIEEQFEEDTIVLVNNNNQNVEIKVKSTPLDKSHSIALKKANKEGQKVDPLARIKNRFDEFSRHKYFSQIQFIRDYKSGYAPIDIQNQQEKELNEMQINEQEGEEAHKQHFIRRKQSQNINLKRSCGVSYVKQPESKQENVNEIYERLPQLVFQCSNGQPKLFEHEYLYEKLYQKLFTSSNQWLLCTYFESEDESLMRDYLLYPEKRWELCKGRYFLLKSVNQIWPLFIEKYFMCIHLFYDPKELIKCPSMKEFSLEEVQNIIKYSNIHLGLLFKKSINGKKAFKKSLGDAFLGDIQNHPSSKDPQAAKKKGRKSKNTSTEEQNTDANEQQQNKQIQEEVIKNTQNNNSIALPQQEFHMNKTQINKFFKEVKSKLKQEKFLKDLPIFKEKIEEIQKYLKPYLKNLSQKETITPPQDNIDNIGELDANDEKIEALFEIIDQISEQINDEDYQIPLHKEIKQRVSTRKDSIKKSAHSPVITSIINQPNQEVLSKMQLNKSQDDKEASNLIIQKDNSEIEIEVESESKISQEKIKIYEKQSEKIEIEKQQENKLFGSNSSLNKKENSIIEEKFEIEESISKSKDEQITYQDVINEKKYNNQEIIEIENQDKTSINSSPKEDQSYKKSALQQLESIEQSFLELNQNAQTFDKLEKISTPSHDNSDALNNAFLKSPSQEKTITREIERINTESTAMTIEENTTQLNLSTENIPVKHEETKQEGKLNIKEEVKIQKQESLICKEILDYIDKDLSSKNINTLSAKLELYVEEKGWKGSSQLVKSLLSTFILYAKDQFEKLALEMMNIRFGIVREENDEKLHETLKSIRLITKNSSKRKPIYENYASMTRSKWDFHENHLQKQNIENNISNKKELKVNEEKLINETQPINLGKILDKDENYSILKRGDFSMPLYYISTRDSFAFDLIEKISNCNFNGRQFTKIEYFFDPDNHPQNFKSFVDSFPDYRVGTTLYQGFFTHEELQSIEDSCYETEVKSFQRHYFPMTAQMTCTAQKIRRTKFFFGSRYIWTRQQLSEPHSFVGAGVRQDVSEPPAWMRRKVVGPLEQAGILPNGFINSLALNVYHDGKEGLAQHFDDATRFRQPIFTFKLFSDARLSFGSQLYGFCNSAFVIPMPRGSVLKLEENSYAANGIKHCVRPCDMAGKNATIIMRQMHHKVVNEANIYDENVDLPTWISTLSSQQDSVPYGDQKEIEAEYLLKKSGQNQS